MSISYTDTALSISETLDVNAIVWLHSLPQIEMGPSNRILEDLETLAGVDGFKVIRREVPDRKALITVMAELAEQARAGLRPILHLDAHGTAEEGLLLAPSADRIRWNVMIDLLRDLNVAARNNLVTVFALCFGLHLYKDVSLMKAVPSYMFFAPSSEVTVGFLESQTLAFYKQVNDSSNITEAFRSTLAAQMESFHCQGIFLNAIARYVRTECRGKRRRDRQEQLVTAILKRDKITNPTGEQLREIREKIRHALDPGQGLVDRFAPAFLIGRSAAFNYEDVERVLDASKSRR